jgi:hypothetical protein
VRTAQNALVVAVCYCTRQLPMLQLKQAAACECKLFFTYAHVPYSCSLQLLLLLYAHRVGCCFAPGLCRACDHASTVTTILL